MKKEKESSEKSPTTILQLLFIFLENSPLELRLTHFSICAVHLARPMLVHQGSVLTEWWRPDPVSSAFASQGQNVLLPPFDFAPQASGIRGICCSQLIWLYQGLSLLWPCPL